MTKRGAGFPLTLLSALLAAGAVVAYLYNCRTPYFATIGVNAAAVGCAAGGCAAQVLALALNWRGRRIWTDVLPVIACVCLTAGLVLLVGARVNEIAFIMTFQKTAANLADMYSAVAAIALGAVAMVVAWVAAFFDVAKEEGR